MTTDEDFTDQAVLRFLQSNRADDAANYTARGRAFASLSDQELRAQWSEAFRRVAADIRDYESMKAWGDLNAEYDLRGVEPPYDSERIAWDRFREAIREMMEEIRTTDPGWYEQINKGLVDDMLVWAAKVDASN